MEIDGAIKPVCDQKDGNQGKRPALLNLSKTGSKRGIKGFPGPFCKRRPCSAALTILLSDSAICFYLFSRCFVLGFYRFRLVIWAVYAFFMCYRIALVFFFHSLQLSISVMPAFRFASYLFFVRRALCFCLLFSIGYQSEF